MKYIHARAFDKKDKDTGDRSIDIEWEQIDEIVSDSSCDVGSTASRCAPPKIAGWYRPAVFLKTQKNAQVFSNGDDFFIILW